MIYSIFDVELHDLICVFVLTEAQSQKRREEDEKNQIMKLKEAEKRRKEVAKRVQASKKVKLDKVSSLYSQARMAVKRDAKANPSRLLAAPPVPSHSALPPLPSTPPPAPTPLQSKSLNPKEPVSYEMTPEL